MEGKILVGGLLCIIGIIFLVVGLCTEEPEQDKYITKSIIFNCASLTVIF